MKPLQNKADAIELLNDFATARSGITSEPLGEIEVHHWEAPHVPTPLPNSSCAVYVFALSEAHGHLCRAGPHRVLKVGKAGAKSNARYQSQHYNFSARSTVAGALVANPILWDYLGIKNLNERNVGEWIREKTERYNFLFKNAAISTHLENYVRAVTGPALEGAQTRPAS